MMSTTLSLRRELVLTDGPERMAVDVREPLVFATAGTQLVNLEKLEKAGVGPAELERLGRAALKASDRARLGFVKWKLGSARAFVATLLEYAGSSAGLLLLHSMRKIADSAGSGRWSFDGVLGMAGETNESRRLGQALSEAGKSYRYQPVSGTAPSEALLNASRGWPWSRFRDAYLAELGSDEVTRALFRIAVANARGERAVLLCCEPYVAEFDRLSDATQGQVGCHRFLLAQRLIEAAKEVGLAARVDELDLSRAARAAEVREEGDPLRKAAGQ